MTPHAHLFTFLCSWLTISFLGILTLVLPAKTTNMASLAQVNSLTEEVISDALAEIMGSSPQPMDRAGVQRMLATEAYTDKTQEAYMFINFLVDRALLPIYNNIAAFLGTSNSNLNNSTLGPVLVSLVYNPLMSIGMQFFKPPMSRAYLLRSALANYVLKTTADKY